MTHIDKHTVTMDVEYHRPESKYAPIAKIKRTVMVDGRRVHMEETLPGDDPTASAAATFERWCIDAERRSYLTGEPPQVGQKTKTPLLTKIKTRLKTCKYEITKN